MRQAIKKRIAELQAENEQLTNGTLILMNKTVIGELHKILEVGEKSNYKTFDEVQAEIIRATKKFPVMADNISDAALVLGEETGEVQQAVLKYFYEGGSYEHITTELIQTAAMCFRFINMLSSIKQPERINK